MIVAIGERQVRTLDEMLNALDAYAPGQTVAVQVQRGNETLSVDVLLQDAGE